MYGKITQFHAFFLSLIKTQTMKRILFFLGFISTFFLKAQFVITATTNPVAGDVEAYVNTYSTGVTQPVSGTNKLWNYTGLNLIFQSTSSSTYIPVFAVPNNNLFTGANLGVMYGPNAYEALKINNSSRTDLGGAATTASDCTVFSDPYVYMNLPFSYGSAYADNISYTSSNESLNGIASLSGSGTGTLLIPGYTFNNVLKVTTTINYTYTSGPAVASITLVSNSFYSSASKFALLTIQSSTVTQGSTTTVDIDASVNKTFAFGVGIEEQIGENNFSVFPNPVSAENVTIAFTTKSEVTNISLVNTLGQLVKEKTYTDLPLGQNNISFDLKDISKGIYYLQIKTGEFESVKKLVVE